MTTVRLFTCLFAYATGRSEGALHFYEVSLVSRIVLHRSRLATAMPSKLLSFGGLLFVGGRSWRQTVAIPQKKGKQ
ncbi:hypothetical protein [Brevibacillus sp. SYSU BS000544]|uniref:hypothetical protein n=1 Tax=Brevibacillus sp. SYSU BS000544 TaxID=3416443 RepID=UPI003CE4DA75